MSDVLMNTKEVARYLDIHEKQVYALIKSGRLPATRVTGKWIFPKQLIDEWIESQARSGLPEARQKGARIEGALLAAGSNDPMLDVLLSSMKSHAPDFYFFTANTGSVGGLKALGQGYTDIAWSHLLDLACGRTNTPAVLSPYLQQLNAVVVHLFNRELGFLVVEGNPHQVHELEDVICRGLRIINRQSGAGTRILLDALLQKTQTAPEALAGYDREVFTHMDVGLAVLTGEADAGIGSAAVARLLGLGFVPLTRESFDMVLDQSTFFSRGVQAFLDVLQSPTFQKKAEKLGAYDFKSAGRVLFTAC
jgi:putative molybdopterin biosynthesis protein